MNFYYHNHPEKLTSTNKPLSTYLMGRITEYFGKCQPQRQHFYFFTIINFDRQVNSKWILDGGDNRLLVLVESGQIMRKTVK